MSERQAFSGQRAAAVGRLQYLLSGLAALISGGLSLAVALYSGTSRQLERGPIVAPLPATPTDSVATNRLRQQVNALEQQLQAVNAALTDQSPSTEVKLAAQLASMQKILEDTRVRIEKLETVILDNPAKALELHLMRRDLENVQAVQAANMASVKDGADRLYDLLKWIVGATAISILSLALTTFLKGKSSADPKD